MNRERVLLVLVFETIVWLLIAGLVYLSFDGQ